MGGAAAGGIIGICVVLVLPAAFLVHMAARRRLPLLLLSTLGVPAAFTLVMLAAERALDDPANEAVRRLGRELAWWSFWPALTVSVIAAVPAFAYAIYRRRSRQDARVPRERGS